MYELNDDYEMMFKNTVNALAKYINDNGIKSLVLGVSGGVDSALVAALAYHAVRRTNNDIPVIGRSITIESNKRDEIERAELIGMSFCDDFKELNLTKMYGDFTSNLELGDIDIDNIDYYIAMGNIKARIRMIQLYHLAGINKGMVLNTDCLSEFMVGFSTIHGDVGDYGMIQYLWKSEVYGLAKWISDKYSNFGQEAKASALDKCINAIPTDGLGITNSDLDQLGATSYEEVDKILIKYLNLKEDEEMENHPVIERHNRTHFKRNNPINLTRFQVIG